MELADDPRQYVRLVDTFGAQSIDEAALALLARNRLYEVRRTGRAPEASKLVQGEVTLFQLSGRLDDRFRPRRLAAGVEGNVVFDLGEVEGLDDRGAQSWRQLLDAVAIATSITLVDLPEALLEPVLRGHFYIGGAAIWSFRVPYGCTGNVEHEELVSLRLDDEPTRLRSCSRCGRPARCIGDGTLMQRVRELVAGARKPDAAVEQVIAGRHELWARARAESGSGAAADTLARYRVLRPLNAGGMAELFLAVHQGIAGFEKLTVLKKIKREMLEQQKIAVTMFLNEAKIAASLNHPNIVQTFEVGEHGGDLFLAMEYVHGADLRLVLQEMVHKQIAATPELVSYIGAQMAMALHHAHTARDLAGRPLNIVHRDISPSNILIGFDGQVKLLDFGVATAIGTTSFDALAGKLGYMSPEQIHRQPLDGRSDIFSLGVVLWELAARRQLFRRATDKETLVAVLEAEIPALEPYGIPRELEAVIRKALARAPGERYREARELEAALEEAMARLGTPLNPQQLANLVRTVLPERSATPPVDPAAYRGSLAADKIAPASDRVATPSPSRSYVVFQADENARTIVEAGPWGPDAPAPEAAPAPAVLEPTRSDKGSLAATRVKMLPYVAIAVALAIVAAVAYLATL
jgi:serine/threonine protein kinase